MLEYQNTKAFLPKAMFQISLKKFLELKKRIKKSLEFKKCEREKVINYMLNGMATTVLLKVGLIKRHSITE